VQSYPLNTQKVRFSRVTAIVVVAILTVIVVVVVTVALK